MPRRRYEWDGLSREERGALISAHRVEQRRPGKWRVQGDTGNYTVRRLLHHCLRRYCRAHARRLCSHRYKCKCPDKTNPCKHIYRVSTLDQDPRPPAPTEEDMRAMLLPKQALARRLLASLSALLDHNGMDLEQMDHTVSEMKKIVRSTKTWLRVPVGPDETEELPAEESESSSDSEDGEEEEDSGCGECGCREYGMGRQCRQRW